MPLLRFLANAKRIRIIEVLSHGCTLSRLCLTAEKARTCGGAQVASHLMPQRRHNAPDGAAKRTSDKGFLSIPNETRTMFSYPVHLEKDTNGAWLVTFSDIPEAASVGDDEDEALLNAIDALESATRSISTKSVKFRHRRRHARVSALLGYRPL